MTPLPKTLLALIGITALGLLPARATAGPDLPSLKPGQTEEGRLPHGGEQYRTYLIRVPQGADRMEIHVDADGDADLYLKPGGPILRDWHKESVAFARTTSGKERIVLTADGIPRLRACTYYLDVVHGGGAEAGPLQYELTVDLITDRPGGAEPLPASERGGADGLKVHLGVTDDFDGRLQFTEQGDRFVTVAIDVAPDVASLSIATTRGTADIDLYMRYGAPLDSWDRADYRATSSHRKKESLALARTDIAPLRSGVYYLDVANPGGGNAACSLSIHYERGYEGTEPTEQAPFPSSVEGVDGEIRADSTFELEFGEGGLDYKTFIIHVTQGTASLLVQVIGARRDVDLHLRHGAPMEDYKTDAHHSANGIRANEQLRIDVNSSPPLVAGTYYLDVFRPFNGPTGPMEVQVRFNAPVPEPLSASSAPIQALTPGERVAAEVPRGAKTARFSVQVPPGARRLHLWVFQATRDIDLVVRHGGEVTSYDDPAGYDHRSASMMLNERIELDSESSPALLPGVYYIDAVSLIGKDEQIAFEIVATLDEPPPVFDEDVPFPPYERDRDPTALTPLLEATVEVLSANGGGSGTCVSPTGYVLTNRHVLEENGEVASDDIYISFSGRFDAPPLQVFVARLIAEDELLDLALVRIDRDVFDRPLPEGLALPWMRIGDPASLRLGEPMHVIGFPGVGGFESRTSISVARGIVSGFVTDADGDLAWIKTDARINMGNSGGAALAGEDLLFVGVPSMEAVIDDDTLGYCRPTTRIPADWMDLILDELPDDTTPATE